jgi:7,8-dihydroneopterin aldolase/epimerase/oxygenase
VDDGGDRIELRGLRFIATHGVHEAERRNSQPFEVDLDLYLDMKRAAGSDDLIDTLDYSAAAEVAGRVLEGPPRSLLETLAAQIAEGVLEDPRVERVTVGIRKLRPPVQFDLGSAGVRLTRSR